MRNTTDKKRGAIICAALGIGFFSVILAVILVPLVGEAYGDVMVWIFLLVYGGIILAIILGIAAALRQRLRELEEDELEAMLVENADEPYAERIARAIVKTLRRGGAIDTTRQLYAVIENALSCFGVSAPDHM